MVWYYSWDWYCFEIKIVTKTHIGTGIIVSIQIKIGIRIDIGIKIEIRIENLIRIKNIILSGLKLG